MNSGPNASRRPLATAPTQPRSWRCWARLPGPVSVSTIVDQVEQAGLRQAAVILVGQVLDPVKVAESYLYDPTRDRTSKLR